MNALAPRPRRAQFGSICLVFALVALGHGVIACGEEADGTTPVCDDPGGPNDDAAGSSGAPAFRTGSSDCFTPLQSVKSDGGAAGAGGSDAGAGGSDAGAGGSDAGAGGSDAGAGGSDAGAAGSDAGAGGSDAGAAGSA
jgi:hypothetical protein